MSSTTLKDFLKKYTAISEKFIDEYYKFYEAYDHNIFGIYIDNVLKYLEITQPEHFLKRLRKNYEINKDYIILRKKKQQKSIKGQKQQKEVYYFLSFDCFEKICMMSHAKKADEVRDYFIILRKFINYYKDHFANKINELVLDDKGVYIILVNKKKNIFKFGETDKSFRSRFTPLKI